jgi:hypothetical protein
LQRIETGSPPFVVENKKRQRGAGESAVERSAKRRGHKAKTPRGLHQAGFFESGQSGVWERDLCPRRNYFENDENVSQLGHFRQCIS